MSEYSSRVIERLLKKINKYDDKDIEKIMEKYIKKAQRQVKKINYDSDTIGFELDVNGTIPDIANLKESEEICIPETPYWFGFIPKTQKIVYCFHCYNDYMTNDGYYYYMDNYDYIYGFAKYIKNKEVLNDMTFLIHVSDYIHKYFFNIHEDIDRNQLHHLIYNNNGSFYEPIKEHSILDFKEKGAAMCSEYAALLQNLLSVFGYQTIYIHGEVDNEDHKNTRHAYNLSIIDNEYSIIDISLPIMCYDYKKGSNKGNFPYICCLDDFNNDKLNEFLSGEKELELDELRTQIINNEFYTFGKPKQRVYRIDKLQSDD